MRKSWRHLASMYRNTMFWMAVNNFSRSIVSGLGAAKNWKCEVRKEEKGKRESKKKGMRNERSRVNANQS